MDKLALLESMLRIRKTELQLASMFRDSVVSGALHLYEGQEAIAVGVCAALRDDDMITSTHRGHGHCIAKGMPPRLMIAEICGRRTGCCGGKGGSMHMFYPPKGILGTIGIVGGGIPIAVGAALSAKTRGADQVAVSFFGDGAANNGAFHESLNMAALWRLPIVFVCEANKFATSVKTSRSTSVEDVSTRAVGYGIPGHSVDGNRVDEVFQVASESVEAARAGGGPSLLVCDTYRIRGHYEGDDTWDYRSKKEVEEARRRDPIEYWKGRLMDQGELDQENWDHMNTHIDQEIAEAVEFAVNSPYPSREDLVRVGGRRA